MIHGGGGRGVVVHRVGGGACVNVPLGTLVTDHLLVDQLYTQQQPHARK